MQLTKDSYLKNKDQFELGKLTTEAIHPLTENLSELLKNDLKAAIDLLFQVDRMVLEVLLLKSKEIYHMQCVCQKVLTAGGRIFISGCGATGRLALSLDKIFSSLFGANKVFGFMAGGDYALIKSIEQFEDNFDFGRRQLVEMGFQENDLLIAITEGGETSFVIGTAEYASRVAKQAPFFLFCNPEDELILIERSQRVINNPKIEKLNLTVGPMAITGSTRMQATTVQMLAAGFSILYEHENYDQFQDFIEQQIEILMNLKLDWLESFIRSESALYAQGGLVTYESQSDLAIAILTDTTERSPTFNLASFEKIDEEHVSLVYLSLKEYEDSAKAWSALLGREPRCLNWVELKDFISYDEFLKFDISEQARQRRESLGLHKVFSILLEDENFVFQLGDSKQYFRAPKEPLMQHLTLKIILNIHSTLVMGERGRFSGNIMTYVKPSNLKLVNRAYRYIDHFAKINSMAVSEEEIINKIFAYEYEEERPVVQAVLAELGIFL